MQELMQALQQGDMSRFKQLLDAEPSLVHSKTPQGVTLLMMAAYMRRGEMAQVLIDRGARAEFLELLALGRTEDVRRALSAAPALAKTLSQDGFTPLCLASHFGHEEIVKSLLAAGADPNQVSENPMRVRPLHSAVAGRDERVVLNIVKELIAHGADPNLRQEGGWAPLHEAVSQSHKSVVEFLVAHGADASAAGTDGRTPRDLVKEGQTEIARLLSKGVSAQAK
ncbi:MAG TPA: ankyrin repeat domain-containing protein [Candidatus Angelobacter sp.]|nr:ankyrin repeat domain-containing protein [Candidatus Angelobacter sp.]